MTTPKEKIAITIPADLVEQAKAAVAHGQASSVSAYITHAVENTYGRDTMAGLIADMIAVTGEPTEEDYAWARQALGR